MSRAGTLVSGRGVQGYRLAVLAILVSARGRPVTRDKIIALLWPESSTDRARHQLSDTLYLLRTALSDDVIRATGDELTLNVAIVSSDVTAFEQLIDAGQLERAVELFNGSLLDGFHLNNAAEFERWLDSERMRLDQHYARVLEQLAQRSEQAGDFAAAVGWWRRLVAHDPHSARIALGLMRSLEATGDRAGALKHARVHAELLQEEFDAQPDSDVVAFAEKLRIAQPARPILQPVAAVHRSPPQLADDDPDTPIASGASAQRRRAYSTLVIAAVTVTVLFGAVYGLTTLRPQAGREAHSLAVLPFVNMSAEPGTDYFADGLSEQIITVLSRIPGLHVAARTSSFALRDAKLDIRTIADTLNVNAVLEGSVRRDGERLRVTAQLIDAASGYHIWSGEYDRELREIVEVQDAIARDIARALELRLPAAVARRASRRTPDLQAYDLYLRALYLRDTFTPEALREGLAYLDRAVELDRGFARAYALKATLLGPAIYWRHVPLEPNVAEARAAIERALELDPALSEAYGALGMLKLFFEWDLPGAEHALRRALELNANDSHTWHMLGNYYTAMGRFNDAVAARARAATIDPLNPRLGFMLAWIYAAADRFPEALAQYQRMLKLHATHPLALGVGPDLPTGPSQVYLKQGRNSEAVEDYVRIATLRGANANEVENLRASFQRSGMPAFWRSWLEFDLRHTGRNPDPVRVATFHALAGDTTQTLEWLDRAYAERNPALIFVFANPAFTVMREHPGFRRIFHQINSPSAFARRLRVE